MIAQHEREGIFLVGPFTVGEVEADFRKAQILLKRKLLDHRLFTFAVQIEAVALRGIHERILDALVGSAIIPFHERVDLAP